MEYQRNPGEKKALDYRAEHRYPAGHRHHERRNWPAKKQLRNQTYRRRLRRSLQASLNAAETELEDISPAPVRRVKSWRRHGVAWNFFKQPYQNDRDRERFAAFLAALTEGRNGQARDLARVFAGVLRGEAPMKQEGRFYRYDRAGSDAPRWLRMFFRDEPTWEERLDAWIAAMLDE